MQDQDSSECKILKTKLSNLCTENGNVPNLIRIVCKELQAWYIGDFKAVKQAYPKFKAENYSNKSKYRNPDVCNASDELKKVGFGLRDDLT